MLLVVGLGNPGERYARNRHNIGFRVLDAIAAESRFPAWKSKHGGEWSAGSLGATRVLLLKPMEFMNLSGFAVQKTAQFHGISAENLIVAHDEVDLDMGVVRLKSGGGHGGNNGLRSIIDQLGDNNFARVRIGVGKPGPKPGSADGGMVGDKNVAGWVLGDFPGSESSRVDAIIARASEAIQLACSLGVGKAMNKINGLPTL